VKTSSTSGPWTMDSTLIRLDRVNGGDRGGLLVRGRQVRGKGNRSLAIILEGADEAESSTLLAAPRLLEACSEAVDDLSAMMPNEGEDIAKALARMVSRASKLQERLREAVRAASTKGGAA